MILNPNPSKQRQENIFSCKSSATNHGNIYFNYVPVTRESIQKHLGFFLDPKLRIENAAKRVNIIMTLML